MTSALFLSARWEHLAMINYEIDPAVLQPLVPKGTELDLWKGKAYVSLVGFMFLDTKLSGFAIPFHRNFEEVNLRFYVKRIGSETGERRGVVFIKEIVPRWAIAYLARRLYNENYFAMPMRHSIEHLPTQITADYQWKFNGKWQQIQLSCQGVPALPSIGSEEEFITEHYWGYSTQLDGTILEYGVKHTPWCVWKADHCHIDVDMKNLYGSPFIPFLQKPPLSAFLAEGSPVTVFKGEKIG